MSFRNTVSIYREVLQTTEQKIYKNKKLETD